LVKNLVLLEVLGHLELLFLGEEWKLKLRGRVDVTVAHGSCVSIRILIRSNLSQQFIEFHVFNFLDVKIQIDLSMIRLQKFAQLHSIIPLLECTFVVANLLSSLTSHVGSILGLRYLESLEVVWTNAILVRPKHSDERSVASLLPLVFPAVVVDLDHHLVFDPLADLEWSPFSELLNEVLLALLLVVDSSLLEMVYYPLVV
jgi:hypothetical protein